MELLSIEDHIKFLILLIFIIISCAHPRKNPTMKKIDLFCRDVSVATQKISVYANNIANKNTTRTPEGGYYKERIVKDCENGICKTTIDEKTPPILRYDPKHPDANKNGYVAYPPLSEFDQQVLMIRMQRTYDALMENSPVENDFFFNDERAEHCFRTYPHLNDDMNYKKLLER
ncbi:MAG: flagellar basal body rod protein FlgC [Bacteriovoracaceae bacterium]